ncbi:MAG: hypothetical protein JAY99_10885 [Candidatus Thiodiazotropha lotti]|nr:hypothetical protein [Candidatus Thiodiazotropha lotti]MCG8000023.1 hypothetical protein [Candidatus Thiodiazotropha lotti]MCW4184241.1 hypothetical protein [Candidatus Thiodiazotropha weberae]MCW4191793.1 hypothetical protein [Candidatus Thiodiazotropha weberae]
MGRQIDLLLPGLHWDTALKQLNDQEYRPKNLERVLGKAKIVAEPGTDLTTTLFSLFGVGVVADRDLPSGAVTAFTPDRQSDGDCWALATPVHLLADRDRLILIRLAPQSIESDYAQRLISRFNSHFETEGLSLVEVAQGQWCMKLSTLPDMTTSDIESVAGRHIETFMPSGRDSASWRGLLNEIQMLFYQEEMNQQRMLQGDSYVNGIWLSGFGVCPEIDNRYRALFGSHPLLSGLARLSKLPVSDPPSDIAEATAEDGNIAILFTDLLEAELNADTGAWVKALSETEQKLCDLLEVVDSAEDKLSIYTCKGYRFEVRKRGSIVNLFKGNKSLFQILGFVNSDRK